MSVIDKYINRHALIYYVLALPAIILEGAFSIGVASNPVNALVAAGGEALAFVSYVPWAIFLVSIYALLRFRPSLLVSTLAISFFLSAVTNSEASFLGAQGGFGLSVGLVIVTAFSALIAFNYSRGATLRAGKELNVEARGPAGFQLLGTGFEAVLPLAVTLALVALVSGIVGVITVQARLLPEPLSTLSTLYLTTRFGIVLTAIAVAGALIWSSRQLLEPVIMYFAVTHEDAVSLALAELQDISNDVKKTGASRGMRRLVLSLVLLAGVVTLTLFWVGEAEVLTGLGAMLTNQARTPTAAESSLVTQIDGLAIQAQRFLNILFRMLWG